MAATVSLSGLLDAFMAEGFEVQDDVARRGTAS